MDGSEFTSNPALELRELHLFAAHRARGGSADASKPPPAQQGVFEQQKQTADIQVEHWDLKVSDVSACRSGAVLSVPESLKGRKVVWNHWDCCGCP